MTKILIEFELPETTTAYRKFTQPSGKLVMALREAIEDEDEEAREWLSNNVLAIDVAGPDDPKEEDPT